MQPLEVGGISCHHSQHVVRAAGGQIALGDLGNRLHRLFERSQIAIGLPLERDADDESNRDAHLGSAEHGGIALDDTGLFQQSHAPQAGRFRQAHAGRKRRIGLSGVALKLAENLAI